MPAPPRPDLCTATTLRRFSVEAAQFGIKIRHETL